MSEESPISRTVIEYENPREGTKVIFCIKDLRTEITWGFGTVLEFTEDHIKEVTNILYKTLDMIKRRDFKDE